MKMDEEEELELPNQYESEIEKLPSLNTQIEEDLIF